MRFDRLRFLSNIQGFLFILIIVTCLYTGYLFRGYMEDDKNTNTILSAIKEAQLSQERLIGELPLSVTCKK